MTALKVLSFHQPYASLVIAGIKPWETRPAPLNGDMRPEGGRGLPGLSVNAGERIAIHAAKAWGMTTVFVPGSDMAIAIERVGGRFAPVPKSPGLIAVDPLSLPLGAILGTVEVRDCIQVYDSEDLCDRGLRAAWERHITVDDTRLTLWQYTGYPVSEWDETDISDQLPFGDWRPGRWAIELADPEPFDEPIPAKGKQGVWRWEA